MLAVPHLCCPWRETQPKVPEPRAEPRSGRISEVSGELALSSSESEIWLYPLALQVLSLVALSPALPAAPSRPSSVRGLRDTFFSLGLGSRSVDFWVPGTGLGTEQAHRDCSVSK